ncbi:rhodanese-like domain-containing protein [Thermodesulfobacteriota bacterium]
MKSFFTYIMSVCFVLVITSGICFGISCEALKDLMAGQDKITLIDIRGNADFARGHIPGAINIPARLCKVKQLPPFGRVIVYGDGIDEGPAIEATTVLNQKSGITAERLNGGISRWEALNYATTREMGMERENIPYVSYQQLNAMVQSNSDIVLFDLRKSNGSTAQSQTVPEGAQASDASTRLTDLAEEFPGVRVVHSVFDPETGSQRTVLGQSGELKEQKAVHSNVYVLIDSGDGSADIAARQLKAAGIKRLVILAGGEETLVRKGRSEIQFKRSDL